MAGLVLLTVYLVLILLSIVDAIWFPPEEWEYEDGDW